MLANVQSKELTKSVHCSLTTAVKQNILQGQLNWNEQHACNASYETKMCALHGSIKGNLIQCRRFIPMKAAQ